jgi:hypothetical protein
MWSAEKQEEAISLVAKHEGQWGVELVKAR